MDSISSSDFELTGEITNDNDPHSTDAEAALEALRAAINNDNTDDFTTNQHDASNSGELESNAIAGPSSLNEQTTALSGNAIQQQSVEKVLASLSQLSSSNITIIDQLNVPSLLSGLAGSLELLVKSNKRQAELIRTLNAQYAAGCECLPPEGWTLTDH